MRISDWSSDVCSSDLARVLRELLHLGGDDGEGAAGIAGALGLDRGVQCEHVGGLGDRFDRLADLLHLLHHRGEIRSEEHTSELQSLMRISYAVFCLKKKIMSESQTQAPKTTKHNTHQYKTATSITANTHTTIKQ